MPSAALPSIPMIDRLVGFDTTSRLSNLALIDWVKSYLAEHGVESRLIFDEDGKKANLFATLGPQGQPGLVLSGHTDVVPVDGQAWDTDPFVLTERDGKLYGRGTSDMKSFLAVVLTMVPEFVRRELKTPIHLALSYDEEVGCIGVRRLIADLAEHGIRPLSCIVGEPTEMKVITGHKGKLSLRGTARGLECHSALAPQGVNAVEYAAEAVAHIRCMARGRRRDGPFNRLFDPGYTTIHTGVMRGGTALNIVPRECTFDFEFRFIPGDDPAALRAEIERYCRTELEPEMHAVSPDTGISFQQIGSIAGLDIGDDAEITNFVKSLSGANATGKVSFGTEAGLFQQAGIPTVICGPGSIEQAHKPNEFVTLEQIALCERFMRRMMDRVCVN
jgi:acetylornithine deacetylase